MSRLAIAVALLFLLAPMAAAPEDFPQTPQIRVSTRLVEVDVIVRDKNGPVANLTKNDFTVLDRGKSRQISVFSVDSARTPLEGTQPLPQNTFSDLPQYGATAPRSVTIVLLDNLNTLYGSAPGSFESTPFWIEDLALQNARTHLIQFLEHLGPQDRVAIYGLTHSLHVLCDFTSDRAELLTVVKNYDTTSKTSREIVEPGAIHTPFPNAAKYFDPFENGQRAQLAGAANENRGTLTMAALESIAAHVTNIRAAKISSGSLPIFPFPVLPWPMY